MFALRRTKYRKNRFPLCSCYLFLNLVKLGRVNCGIFSTPDGKNQTCFESYLYFVFYLSFNNMRFSETILKTTFQLSKLAVGSTIDLVDSILRNEVQNGMAIIRPTGHHAMQAEYNGYCFFNKVGIAAQHALDNRGVSSKSNIQMIQKFPFQIAINF